MIAVSSATIPAGSLKAWVLACRPATLTAAFTPVAVGTACALQVDSFRPAPALAALVGALLLQVGSNFANDVFDFEKGADTEERLGPTRAVQAGLVSPADMRRGMWLVFGLALLVGVYLTAVAGPAIVILGLASIAAAIAYTGGPYPLGYHGLGDVFVMLFFGFVAVCGTTFVQAGTVPPLSLIAAVPVGSLATNILVVNNLRDRETDARVGKRTLAVRWGRSGAIAQHVTLTLVAYMIPVVLVVIGRVGAWALLPLLSIPVAARNVAAVRRESGRALNPVLVRTAKLLFLHGLLFSLGLTLDVVLR